MKKDKKRILLINSVTLNKDLVPSTIYFPMSLLYLGTVLKNNGIEVKILDMNNHCNKHPYADAEKIVFECIDDFNPSVIGIGCTFSGAFKSLKSLAKKIKEKYPGIPIVIGGIHATIFPEEILKGCGYIDFVVIGEGESTFLKLVNCIMDGTGLPEDVDGVAFRKKENIIVVPKRRFTADLDGLPFIDYSLIDTSEYDFGTDTWYSPKEMKIGRPFTIVSSRSCPNRCTFCSMRLVHGPEIRFRSSGNVLDEMERLYNEYDIRYFQFMDDNITFDKQRILEICGGIKRRNMTIQFDTPNGMGINRLDKDIIDAMVDAGLVYTSLGIESGSEFIRNKIMKKGLSAKRIYEAVECCARHKNLFIKGFFIIGMPEETVETLEETYDMIRNLPLDKISVNFVSPYPGTELFDYCADHRLLPYRREDYVDIEIFQDTDEKPHFKPHGLSINDLISFRRRCFDYMKQKRARSSLPNNYPIRYEDKSQISH